MSERDRRLAESDADFFVRRDDRDILAQAEALWVQQVAHARGLLQEMSNADADTQRVIHQHINRMLSAKKKSLGFDLRPTIDFAAVTNTITDFFHQGTRFDHIPPGFIPRMRGQEIFFRSSRHKGEKAVPYIPMPQHSTLLIKYYGLTGNDPIQNDELANMYHLSPTTVHNTIATTRRHLIYHDPIHRLIAAPQR